MAKMNATQTMKEMSTNCMHRQSIKHLNNQRMNDRSFDKSSVAKRPIIPPY